MYTTMLGQHHFFKKNFGFITKLREIKMPHLISAYTTYSFLLSFTNSLQQSGNLLQPINYNDTLLSAKVYSLHYGHFKYMFHRSEKYDRYSHYIIIHFLINFDSLRVDIFKFTINQNQNLMDNFNHKNGLKFC